MNRLAFQLARRDIAAHRTRSRLSSFGIVICVFIISLVLILSDSLTAALSAELGDATSGRLIVNGATDDTLLGFMRPPNATLTKADYHAVEQVAANTSASQYSSSHVTAGGVSVGGTIVGTTATDASVFGATIAGGSWMNDSHSENKAWVVLGYDLANQLIGSESPQSQVVRIGGRRFTVVGILAKSPRPLSIYGIDLDSCAFMSLTNSSTLTKSTNLSQLIVDKANYSQRAAIAQAITEAHRDDGDYQILSSHEITAQINSMLRYILAGTAIITAIILVLSCISIANSILVGVAERRREIGIRKAVGATSHDIIAQFMIESALIAFRAAIVGFILAYLVGGTILLLNHLDITFSLKAAILGLIIPVVVSIIAGIYPAIKASRQDIIAALNQLT